MAKVKSIKFYNHERTYQKWIVMAARFYDQYGKLVILDFLNSPFYQTKTFCETSECIATASRNDSGGYIGAAFHTGNFNKEIGLNSGRFYCYSGINSDNVLSF